MSRWSLAFGVVLVLSLVGVIWFGIIPFAPPVRPPNSVALAPVPEPSRVIYFIVPGPPSGDVLAWATAAQTEANNSLAVFKVIGPKPGESSMAQSQTVKQALADQASALLVFAGDSPDLAKTLVEAEASGIPVVLIGRSIPAPEGSKPFTMIEFGDLTPTANQIVAATVEDAKKAGRPMPPTGLILADKVLDSTSESRVAALKKAAVEAKFAKVLELQVDGSNVQDSVRQIYDLMKANPDLSVILTDDPETMVAATQVRVELKGKPALCVGGYVDFSTMKVAVPLNSISCFGQGRFDQLAVQGVKTLISKLKREPTSDLLTLKPAFKRLDPGDAKDALPYIRKLENEKPDTKTPAEPAKQ